MTICVVFILVAATSSFLSVELPVVILHIYCIGSIEGQAVYPIITLTTYVLINERISFIVGTLNMIWLPRSTTDVNVFFLYLLNLLHICLSFV